MIKPFILMESSANEDLLSSSKEKINHAQITGGFFCTRMKECLSKITKIYLK